MKIECPICHVEGVLQQRGNSYRVQHYQGFENGKRIYLYHKVEGMEVNGSKSGSNVEVKKTDSSIFHDKEAGPTGIEPATYGLRVRRSNLTELRARCFSLKRLYRDLFILIGLFPFTPITLCFSYTFLPLMRPS
jgi:hypothetical protein